MDDSTTLDVIELDCIYSLLLGIIVEIAIFKALFLLFLNFT